jgi:hypothetical protein
MDWGKKFSEAWDSALIITHKCLRYASVIGAVICDGL